MERGDTLRLQGRNIGDRAIARRFLHAKCKDRADETKQRADEKWGAAIFIDRFSQIEHQQPAADERANKSSGASRGLHYAERAALPGAIDHLRRQSTEGRTGETAAGRE